MTNYKNSLDQPTGFPLDGWQAAAHPEGSILQGRLSRLEPLRERHAQDLFEAYSKDLRHRNWTYLPYGPFATLGEFQSWLVRDCLGDDPCFFAVIDLATGKALGLASYLRIKPAIGVIEVGHIHFSPLMQGGPISTEAMFLMMRRVFDDLGYRRYEWKCDALNAPSCAAALRLGFKFEGIFRQATIYKSRNRDTAWYSILDSEWPKIKPQFETWLAEENFDADGKQRSSLSKLTRAAFGR